MYDNEGMHPDLQIEDYQADRLFDKPSLSSSIIHAICAESPLHAWHQHPRLNPDYRPDEAEHFDIGTIAHALLLQGVAHGVVLDFPDWRTARAREARSCVRAEGKIAILTKHWDAIEAMVRAARLQLQAHEDASDALTHGRPEVTLAWQEDGIYCRARPDWLHNSHALIDDYKTTSSSANPELITRTLFSNGWDIQAAWYLRGLELLSDIGSVQAKFRFVVQETFPPYALSVIAPGPDVLMLAEKKIMYAMDQWRLCLDSGVWPGYPQCTCYASVPAWVESQWLAKELA